mgnify:CR=1 FL=1
MYDYEWDRLRTWLSQYGAIDESVVSAQEITRLDLSGKSLKELPESIGILSHLLVLNLSNNRLTTLPDSMKNLTALKNLDLRRNSFELLPAFIPSLTLTSLNVSGNKLQKIDILKNAKSLKVLDASANLLSNLENFLSPENELRTLNLSSNFIKNMSPFLSNLSQLERLNMSNNFLVELPQELAHLKSIIELDFSSNKIEKIESAFFDLEVEEVDLSVNSLKRLTLHSLESLEKLTLDENSFVFLSVDESFAPYLKEFSCDSCSLSRFLLPPSKSLELLCYSSNAIKSIPDEISQYTQLNYLDLEENAIEDFPDSLGNLSNLKTLYVAQNPLTERAMKILEVLSPEICDIRMKSGITIERAKREELPQMAKLLAVLFAIEKDFAIDYEKQISAMEALYEDERTDLLVAKHEERVVGMLTMQRLISSAEGGFVGQIEDLVVYEEFRKMGVGSRLINKMRAIAQEHHYKRIQLSADVENLNALAFYNRRGFYKTNLNVYHYIS